MPDFTLERRCVVTVAKFRSFLYKLARVLGDIQAARKSCVVNSYCDVCVAIHSEFTRPLRYREELILKADRDFTLQVLSLGYKTLRTSRFSFACPENGSNGGGLSFIYKTGKEVYYSRLMEQIWGSEICRFHVKPNGRPDIKVNWRFFRNESG